MGWLARLARGDGSDGVAVAVRCDGGTVGTTRAWVVGEVRRGKRGGNEFGAGGGHAGMAGGDGWVAAGSITETAGRAAERATKGDENFPAAAKILSARHPREKFVKNPRSHADAFEFDRAIHRSRHCLTREILFL